MIEKQTGFKYNSDINLRNLGGYLLYWTEIICISMFKKKVYKLTSIPTEFLQRPDNRKSS